MHYIYFIVYYVYTYIPNTKWCFQTHDAVVFSDLFCWQKTHSVTAIKTYNLWSELWSAGNFQITPANLRSAPLHSNTHITFEMLKVKSWALSLLFLLKDGNVLELFKDAKSFRLCRKLGVFWTENRVYEVGREERTVDFAHSLFSNNILLFFQTEWSLMSHPHS